MVKRFLFRQVHHKYTSMNDLYSSIPDKSISQVKHYLSEWNVQVKIVSKRKTKHGDYRKTSSGKHQITINKTSNPYRFLITLIHEIAHHVAFKEYGYRIKPHGKEWKYIFQKLMLPLINPQVFPDQLLSVVARHFKSPKASSDTDFNLVMALSSFDPVQDKTYVFELEEGSNFSTPDGREFVLGKKRVKRYECEEISTRKKYIFSPHAEVYLVEK